MMDLIEKEQLKVEIAHIFDSGANEIRIFEMVKSFIDRRNGVNKLPIHDVIGSFWTDGAIEALKTEYYERGVKNASDF